MEVSTLNAPLPPDVFTKPLEVSEPNLTEVKEPPVKEAVPSVRVVALAVPEMSNCWEGAVVPIPTLPEEFHTPEEGRLTVPVNVGEAVGALASN